MTQWWFNSTWFRKFKVRNTIFAFIRRCPRTTGYGTVRRLSENTSSESSWRRLVATQAHRYTNHYLRATTVTLLDDANQEGRHIISVTEHASVTSLGPYSRTSEKRKKTMSDILTFGLDGNDTSDYEPPAKKSVPITSTIRSESPRQGSGRPSTGASVIISPRQGT